MPYFRYLILFFLLAVLPQTASPGTRNIILIANPDVKADTLSAADVKDIFLGKKTHWDNGDRITFYTSKDNSIHRAFLESYIGKSAAQYKKIWRRRVFSGRGKAPKSSGSNQEMANLVSETSGSIGYASTGADIGRLKIISVK